MLSYSTAVCSTPPRFSLSISPSSFPFQFASDIRRCSQSAQNLCVENSLNAILILQGITFTQTVVSSCNKYLVFSCFWSFAKNSFRCFSLLCIVRAFESMPMRNSCQHWEETSVQCFQTNLKCYTFKLIYFLLFLLLFVCCLSRLKRVQTNTTALQGKDIPMKATMF